MTQHYQRNVTAVSKWCPTCGKITMHRVDDRRLGPCTEPHVFGMSKAQEKRAEKKAEEERQPDLFSEAKP
jgi:ribosomal protein L44E